MKQIMKDNLTGRLLLTVLFAGLLSAGVFAKENKGKAPVDPKNDPPPPPVLQKGAGCAAATAQRDLDVNNVRTTILNGGDMWWNLSNARYEVPKVQTGQVAKHSLFSGALWIGGVTNGNLRIAAQTYRQSGNDFYPGPLTIGTASITQSRCKDFDRIWRITLKEINEFKKDPTKWSTPSEEIRTWPCMGNTSIGEAQYLAPFFDFDQDGRYTPETGDYPTFDQDVEKNIPDMMLFILYNDKGNIHAESEGVPIGLELHTQAFGYATNDEVNNMTFYRTTIFNRSNEIIDSCVFGQWVDADLGNYSDDYVECDVDRNLGICYNGDDNDEGTLGYGLNPPSIGVNFFEGPRRADSTEIGLTKFVYYNNDFSPTGNPSRPEHYWGYLNGKWKDGAVITYGGNGKGGADTASYMFPGDTDPAGRATWNERNSSNQPSDRRFLQTAGSFSLLPGAVNRVTIGVVWAKASSGGATGSFNLLKQASDKAFTLFKNNFELITGPDAPQLEIVELKNKLVFKMLATDSVENYSNSFQGPCAQKTEYKFQGYLVYQLKTPNVPNDFYDSEEAKLIAQFDVTDGNSKIVNAVFDPDLEEDVKKIMVVGEDKGIQHTFEITKDFFETGTNQTLVNFKNYHYLVLSYASATNCATDRIQFLAGRNTVGAQGITIYSATPHDPAPRNGGTQLNADYGTGLPVTQIEGIGNGGNFIELSQESIDEAMREGSGYVAKERKYQTGFSPIEVKVIDPIKLPVADFTLWMRDSAGVANTARFDSLHASRTYWFIRNNTTGEVRAGQSSIANPYEQLFNDWGISVKITQAVIPGDVDNSKDASNGFLDSKVIWENPSQEWLGNITDEDPNYTQFGYGTQFNWIRSGSSGRGNGAESFNNPQIHDFAIGGNALDPRRNYSKIIDGTWSPYALAARWRTNSSTTMPTFGPGWDIGLGYTPGTFGSAPQLGSTGGASADNPLKDLQGVDFVITPDRSKWTRCLVVETGEDYRFNQNYADKMDRRRALSVDKYGRNVNMPGAINDPSNPEAANYLSDSSMGWFPGYAINVETGERLNIMFGEDSSIPLENGNDMRWNPTSNLFDRNGRPVFGGKHYVYVMAAKRFVQGAGSSALIYEGPRYDGGLSYFNKLERPGPDNPSLIVRKRQVYSQVLWTTMPVLAPGYKLKDVYSGVVPGTVTYKIRVKKPYALFNPGGATINDSMPLYKFSTSGFAPTISSEVGKKALDNIAVVPNPYYAYSSYEDPGNQLDNRIRITNLPPRCDIRIYTLDGILVRTIRKDDPKSTYLEWNLKNDAQVPVTSGIYLFHFKATDLGEERIVKWVGIMRPADYDSF